MGMELGCGVAINRAGGVMLELGDDELTGGFGGIVAADPCLRVSLQLREGDGHGLPMSLANTVISAYQSGQRDGLWSGERRVPSRTVLHWFDGRSVCGRVLLALPMLY
jgi:hypothetical protein